MPINKKNAIIAAAIAGLMTSSAAMAGSAFPGHDSMKRGKQCGISCTKSCCKKGEMKCGGAEKASCKSAEKSAEMKCGGAGHSCGGK